MEANRKKMIANLLKEGRMAKGYTQKELSELSHISIRSIQRIENAEIVPRSYTLKTLAGILDISFDAVQEDLQVQQSRYSINHTQKWILSIGSVLLLFFACWAFIAQSPRFPETTFELLVLVFVALLFVTAILFLIWRKGAGSR